MGRGGGVGSRSGQTVENLVDVETWMQHGFALDRSVGLPEGLKMIVSHTT